MHPQSILYSFEVKDEFIPVLEKITDMRLRIIHGSATDVIKHTGSGKVDCIISSIPFTIIPKEIGYMILEKAKEALTLNGSFHQVLYTVQVGRFEKHFADTHIKPVLNFPLAFIHHNFKQKQAKKEKRKA
jgi:phospholipid N-methyltransferase